MITNSQNFSASQPHADAARPILRDLARLGQGLRGHWLRIVAVLVCLAVAAATEPAVVAVIKHAIDWGKVPRPSWLDYWMLPVAIPLVYLVRGLAAAAASHIMGGVCADAVTMIQQGAHRHMLTSEHRRTRRMPIGKLVHLLTFEVKQCSDLLERVTTKLVRHVLTLLALYGSLILLNWRLTAWATLAIPVVAGVCWALFGSLRQLTALQIRLNEELADRLIEHSRKVSVVKLHGAVGLELERFDRQLSALRSCNLSLYSVIAACAPLTQVLAVSLAAVIIFWVARATGLGAMSKGEAVAYVANLMLILPPLKNLAELNGPILRSIVGMQSVFSVAGEGPVARERPAGAPSTPERLAFRDITLAYPGQDVPALRQLTATFRRQEMVAIVGPSGAGKSSLFHVLRADPDAYEGEVLIDGLAVSAWRNANTQPAFTLVDQQPQLLNRTVLQNIAYGDPEPDQRRVWQALAGAHLDKVVQAMPLGLETEMGTGANRLSGGQTRLLAVARAFYANAPVVLLDEPTASLDAESEQIVLRSLDSLRPHRTILVITHSAAVAARADRVLYLRGGMLAAEGTHADLCKTEDGYAQLFRAHSTLHDI